MRKILALILVCLTCTKPYATFERYREERACVMKHDTLERLDKFKNYFYEVSENCSRRDNCLAEDMLYMAAKIAIENVKENPNCQSNI